MPVLAAADGEMQTFWKPGQTAFLELEKAAL